jgi:hypothetical protein
MTLTSLMRLPWTDEVADVGGLVLVADVEDRDPRTVLAAVAVLLPVPWLHVVSADPLGTAWRLDGGLQVEGETIDPPGRWTWLAVGRPQLVFEVLRDRLVGADRSATDLRAGPAGRRPSLSEPAAAAIGMRQAGDDLIVGVSVEVRRPLLDGYPETGFLDTIDGTPLTDQRTWDAHLEFVA